MYHTVCGIPALIDNVSYAVATMQGVRHVGTLIRVEHHGQINFVMFGISAGPVGNKLLMKPEVSSILEERCNL